MPVFWSVELEVSPPLLSEQFRVKTKYETVAQCLLEYLSCSMLSPNLISKKSEIFGLPWSFILVWRAGAREGEVDIDR